MAQSNLIEIPINVGSRPNWNTRFGNPQLFNMFATGSGIYCTAGQLVIINLPNVRTIHRTVYNGGSTIVVTNDIVYKVGDAGTVNVISSITFSGLPVKIDENLQNQITIADGGKFPYVIDQRAGDTFTQITETQGLDARLTDVISVVVLNTFTVLLSTTGFFQISSPNNALMYNMPPLVAQIDSSLTQGAGLASLDNNLYIFGLTGNERWEAFNTNDYAFPFQRDNNYRSDYGVASNGSIVRGIDQVYFLSNKYIPCVLNLNGVMELAFDTDGRPDMDAALGISRVIGEYADVTQSLGSFYNNKANYYYHLTFPTTGNAWVYTIKSKTYFETDDLVVSALPDNSIVAKADGLYQLQDTPIVGLTKRRMLIPPRVLAYKGSQPYRNLITNFEVRLAQGNFQPIAGGYQNPNNQMLELSLSLDSLTFGNVVRAPMGLTAQRQAVTTWRCSQSTQEITPKLEYYGDYDLAIEKFTMTIT